MKLKTQNSKLTAGFTLVEMIVSIGIFTIVMLIATSSIFTVVAANQKAQSLKLVMNNLDFALDSMVRDVRVGSGYTCEDTCSLSGNSDFSFTSNTGASVEYYLDTTNDATKNEILEYNSSWDGGTGGTLPITATGITITSLKFYVINSADAGSNVQSRVLITITGTAGAGSDLSTFNIQTTVSERQLEQS